MRRSEGKSPCDQTGPFSFSSQLLGDPNSLTLTHAAANSGLPLPPPLIPPTLNYLTAQHHLSAHPPPPTPLMHTCILSWRGREGGGGVDGGGGGATLPAPSLEKPESITPPRHFEGGYRPVHILSSSSSSFPALSHLVSISLHGFDLTPRHATHPGVHHHQCVCGLQHPSRAPDRTSTGSLQTGEVRFRP